MIYIFHNIRCSKSRSALGYLQDSGVSFEIIDYLNSPPSHSDLDKLLKKMNNEPESIIRKNESLYKENYKNQMLSRSEWLQILASNPILIERPIIFDDKKAVVGRPPELVLEFLKSR